MDIELKNLRIGYAGKPLYFPLNRTLEQGKSYRLSGPSGCGKTTLLRTLLGLQMPVSGEIAGENRFSVCFQEDRLLPQLTLLQNVLLTAPKTCTREKASALLAELLPELTAAETVGKYPAQLSGGQKRRVAVARALLAEADWLLLDEPFGGLDEDAAKRTETVMRREKGSRGLILCGHGGSGLLLEEIDETAVQI